MAEIDVWRSTRPPNYTEEWHFNQMFKAARMSYDRRTWMILEKAVRHGGSEVFNIYAPAGRLAVDPFEKFQVVNSGLSLASKFCNSARNVIRHPNYPVPYKLIAPDLQSQWTIDTGQVGDNDATYFASGIDGARQ